MECTASDYVTLRSEFPNKLKDGQAIYSVKDNKVDDDKQGPQDRPPGAHLKWLGRNLTKSSAGE